MTNPTAKPLLRDLSPARLRELVAATDEPSYRADQLADWLFTKGVLSWQEMSNVPASLRMRIASQYDLQATIVQGRQVSADGTRKLLLRCRDGETIESVVIPMEKHPTFCLSSQVGCRMACRFCATARGGLVRSLLPAEILEQVFHLRAELEGAPVPGHGRRQFNLVFMGMGEPLDNWPAVAAAIGTLTAPDGFGISPRRITVSTSGPLPGLTALLDFPHPVGLTLSLGGATDALRKRLMPRPGGSTLDEVLGIAERYARRLGRPVTLAYVLIAGVNDDPELAGQLARLAARKPFKVNLIPLNTIEGDELQPSPPDRVGRFQEILAAAGLRVFIRESGGRDIAAACGQLRARRKSSAPARTGR